MNASLSTNQQERHDKKIKGNQLNLEQGSCYEALNNQKKMFNKPVKYTTKTLIRSKLNCQVQCFTDKTRGEQFNNRTSKQ